MSVFSNKPSELGELEARVRNRESWLKVGVVAVFSILVGWKLTVSTIPIGVVDFPTLLTTLLSLFAIALSLAFYFKATETSNTFYDNTYRFTKDISEILGRIEAGFGERLRHLDEGYSGLRESVSKMPPDQGATRQALHLEEETIKQLEAEKATVLAQLAERAKLQEAEKRTLFDQMEAKDRELRQARAETAFLRRRLVSGAPPVTSAATGHERLRSPMEEALRRVTQYVQNPAAGPLVALSARESESTIRERFLELREAFPEGFIDDLRLIGFVSGDNQLTIQGLRWLRRLAKGLGNKDLTL